MNIGWKKSFTKLLGAALVLSPFVLGACGKAEQAGPEARIDQLESREEIRSMLLSFVAVVDSGDPTRLSELIPMLDDDFRVQLIDFLGGVHRFEGSEELLRDYAPIMASAQADLVVSAIAVELEGEQATAAFKGIGSVLLPPELGLDLDLESRLLLFADGTAVLVREGEGWRLKLIEIEHSLAYPSKLPELDE